MSLLLAHRRPARLKYPPHPALRPTFSPIVENLINRRCMGVSTRYLMNYFGWSRRITQHKPFGNDLLDELLGA